MLQPGLLNGMVAFFGQTLDGGDSFVSNRRYRKLAGTHSRTIEVDGTGAALGNTTSIFCTDKVEMVPQHPQHRCSRVNVYLLRFSVDIEIEDCHDGKNY